MLRILLIVLMLATPALAGDQLLNVSYDPTRELWKAVNASFIPAWQQKSGQTLEIKQSHGGSGTQARAVVDGLEADVVTLAMWPDTDAIRKVGLISDGWESRFPNNSTPYTSTIVFLVRKGNPKGIRDWADIIKPGVEIVTPNPKTSGNGKLAFLTAWGQVLQNGGSEADAKEFVTKLYSQAPVLDTGARASSVTFAQKGIGDVQLTWENEAHLQLKETPGEFEIVYPSVSFLAEPPVAVVDVNARRHGTTEAATAYLDFLYTPAGQELVAQNYYRPIDPAVAAKYQSQFPVLRFFTIDAVAKDWNDAYAKFFGDGKIFDSIYQGGK
ncbi:MAG TPA: sulfate ABC transporter substrate-binding protein [Candidatus Dormibacteraeota bacterium]|nr:sulfate ABC transporter substrate-binding protein [Candidatus Dormibacteraeota bacterium]